jgi:hypothetical protein
MIEDRLNPSKVITNAMPSLIEAFVSFYGEDKREEIEERFNNVIIAGYVGYPTYKSIANEVKKSCALEALELFKEESGITDPKELDSLFGLIQNFEYSNLVSFYSQYENETFKDFALNTIKSYAKDDTLTYDDEKTKKIVDYFYKLKPITEKMMVKYKELYNERAKPYFDYLDNLEKLKQYYITKNSKDYLYELESKGLLSENDITILHGDRPLYNDKMDCHGLLGGKYTVLGQGLLESFSIKCDETLSNPDEKEWIKESIRKDRVDYFKKIGIDLGNEYEAYANSDRCLNIWPSQRLVDEIESIKEKYNNKAEYDFLENMPHHSKLKEVFKNIPFLANPLFGKTVSLNQTCILTDYVREDNDINQKKILYFSADNSIDEFDCKLVHELNHLYEVEMQKVNGDNAISLVGWDIFVENINDVDEQYDEEGFRVRRNYEMLNEIINELIAQDICKSMHDKGIYIMGGEGVSINSSKSNYEIMLRRFVKDFYTEFKEDIIESRKNNNMNSLFDKIGEDNFNEFNNMLRDYSVRFRGMKIYKLYDDLRDNKDNPDTRYYNECMNKKNELMDKFREHKAQYLENEVKSK